MKEISLHTADKISRILVGESFQNIRKYLPDQPVVIISDENVEEHYSGLFPGGMRIIIKPGEASKSLKTATEIYDQLIRSEVDRKSFILGIGGGIVCDLAGYIASTYLRGVSFGFISTTLLAQVDASIGGKNGINFDGYKNMIGIIRQPDFVICDPHTLKTLAPSEFRMGFAEVIKYGAIVDSRLFEYIEDNYQAALKHDPAVLEEIISVSASAKCDIVAADEKESGERKKLNFGHSFAHAFEKLGGIPHGEAVSIGMVLAASLSERLGMISKQEVNRLKGLLINLGLPVIWDGSCSEVFEVMKRDKKRGGDTISLILLESIGDSIIRDVELTDLKNWIDDLC
ncbi:3-dehydroquinate synthase [Bacteroidota bacterium]